MPEPSCGGSPESSSNNNAPVRNTSVLASVGRPSICSVEDARGMRHGEPLEHTDDDPDRNLGREAAIPPEDRTQALSSDVFPDEERDASVRAGIEQSREAQAGDAGGGLRLLSEMIGEPRVVGDRWAKHLDGHGSVQHRVGCLPDHPGPAPSELRFERVSPGEHLGRSFCPHAGSLCRARSDPRADQGAGAPEVSVVFAFVRCFVKPIRAARSVDAFPVTVTVT
jgi:hypothetical protein